jgi:D-alanine-D-alanine ligase
LIVKPANSGSSLGVTRVSETSQLIEAFNTAFKESNHILVEQFVIGREITVGVVRLNGQIKVLPITEIIHPDQSSFFDINSKFKGNGKTQFITPANLNEDTKTRVEMGVTEVYEKFQLSGIVRIDLMLEHPHEKVFFLEVNSAPAQTEVSILVEQLRLAGWDASNLVQFYKQLYKEVL